MATTTTNYNLKIMEGTDLVNYLTDTNPNFTTLDSIIKGIEDSTFTTATHLQTGNVHELTRVNADSPYIIFTATSDFTYGDTFTVDGDVVTASDSEGSALRTNFFETNHIEFCILNGTSLTFLFGGNAKTISGRDLIYILNSTNHTYNNTSSGLTATTVQAAIDEVETNIENITTVNDSSKKLSLTPIKPSFNIGFSDYYNLSYMYKVGTRVVLNLAIDGLKPNSTNAITTLPVGYRPYSSFFTTGYMGNLGNICEITVNANGTISIVTPPGGTNCETLIEFDAFN